MHILPEDSNLWSEVGCTAGLLTCEKGWGGNREGYFGFSLNQNNFFFVFFFLIFHELETQKVFHFDTTHATSYRKQSSCTSSCWFKSACLTNISPCLRQLLRTTPWPEGFPQSLAACSSPSSYTPVPDFIAVTPNHSIPQGHHRIQSTSCWTSLRQKRRWGALEHVVLLILQLLGTLIWQCRVRFSRVPWWELI